MLTDTKFYYLGGMEDNQKTAGHVPGTTPANMSEIELKRALMADFDMLAALINFIRSEPRAITALAEVAYQVSQNRKFLQEENKRQEALQQIENAEK